MNETELESLQKRVKEIRERAEKATPGPWHVAAVLLPPLPAHRALAVWDEAHQQLPNSINGRPIAVFTPLEKLNPQDEANAELLAHARQDIPWLLDQLALEQKRVKELEAGYAINDELLVKWQTQAMKAERELQQLRERVKELEWAQSTEKLNAALALDSDSTVASCNCLTKTPDIQFHKIGCKYRLISERDQLRAERDELRRALTRLAIAARRIMPPLVNPELGCWKEVHAALQACAALTESQKEKQ